jgi:hypothetical protein
MILPSSRLYAPRRLTRQEIGQVVMAGPTHLERDDHHFGLDLGQPDDPSTIAGVQRHRFLVSDVNQQRELIWKDERPPLFRLGHLERIPLGTTYPAMLRTLQT